MWFVSFVPAALVAIVVKDKREEGCVDGESRLCLICQSLSTRFRWKADTKISFGASDRI